MTDKEKICSMLSQGDESLIQWHRHEFSTKMKGLSYEAWEEKVLVGLSKSITIRDFFRKNLEKR